MINLGRDIVVKENALEAAHVRALLSIYEENKEYELKLNKESGDFPNDTEFNDVLLSSERYPKLFTFMQKQTHLLMTEYYELLGINKTIATKIERYTLMRFEKNVGQFEHHIDGQGIHFSRRIGIVWYLNTVAEGGELVFPSVDGNAIVRPIAGSAVIFPTDWTHSHWVRVPKTDDRYGIISFIHH